MNQKQLVFLIAFIVFIVAKLLWWTIIISMFLAISLIWLFFLWKLWKIYSNIIWWFILMIDAILIIVLMVPTKSYNISPSEFYAQRKNYMKIYIKDSNNKVKEMSVVIFNKTKNKIIELSKYKKWTTIEVFPQNRICFLPLKNYKLYKTYAAIYLWDWTILRITPWTCITLKKITKNLSNLADSKTQIYLNSWNIWFHVIKLIKDSSNMKINISTWQSLIIRGTAWLIRKTKETWWQVYIVDYSHLIEVKNSNKTIILNEWEWAILSWENIKKVNQIQEILKRIWITKKNLDEISKLDIKYIIGYKKDLINFLKKRLWDKALLKLEEIKLKVFSIWNKKYKQLLEELNTYQYLIWDSNKITNVLLNNSNIAFIAWNLWQQQAKIKYLYNQTINNLQNSEIYKTYIINLWISWKIKRVSEDLINKAIKTKKFLKYYLNKLWK